MVENSLYKNSQKKISRRKVIKYIAGGIAVTAGALITGGYFLSQPSQREETERPVISQPTTTSTTTSIIQERPKPVETVKLSAYEFLTRLYDESLTNLQRDEFWKENKGKHVQWISEFYDAEATKDGYIAYFDPLVPPRELIGTNMRIISVALPSNQRETLLKLEKSALVTFSGQVESYDPYNPKIVHLEKGSIISTGSPLLLTGNIPFSLGNPSLTSTRKKFLIADKKVYVADVKRSRGDVADEVSLHAYDAERAVGETIWERTISQDIPPLERQYNFFEEIAGSDASNLYVRWNPDFFSFPLTLQAIDKKTGKTVWWERYNKLGRDDVAENRMQEELKKKGIDLPPKISFGERANIGGVELTYKPHYYKDLYAKDSRTERVLWVKSEPMFLGWEEAFDDMAAESDLLYVYNYKAKILGVFRLIGTDLWYPK